MKILGRKPKPNTGGAGLAFLLALSLILSLGTPAFAVPPPIPHGFEGAVTIGTQPAPEGTVISAQVDGEEVASDTVDALGNYALDVPGPAGTIYFYVGDVWAASYAWSEGGVTLLNLAIPGVGFTLTMAVTGAGTTVPSVGNHTYPANTGVDITATADAGWDFVNWIGDVADPYSPETTVTMDADKTVTAIFTEVVDPPFDFSLTVYPTEATVVPGEGTTPTVTATHVEGPVEEVSLTHGDLPAGITVTFYPAAGTPTFTSAMAIAAAADAAVGVHEITITGTAGDLVRTTTFTLTVAEELPFDFSLTVYPTAATITQGEQTTAIVTAELEAGIAEEVTLTAELPPDVAGITVTFEPAAGEPTFLSLTTITTTADVTPADYVITITGTGAGGLVRTTTFTLTVEPPFAFSLAVDPTADTVVQGQGVSANVTATLDAGITEEVTLTADEPEGITVTFDPVAGTPTFVSAMNITTTAVATVGVHPITITGTGTGGLVKTTTFNLNITAAAFDFSLAVDPTAASVTQGDEVTATVTATLDAGIAEDVTLTADAPAGINVTFAPAIDAPTFESTVTIAAAADAPLGDHVITITGTSYPGGVVETVTFTLTVEPPFDFSLAVDPTAATVMQGQQATATVTATLDAGITEEVTLTYSLPDGVAGIIVTLDPAAGTPTFTSTMTIAAAADATLGEHVITITGTAGALVETVTFTLTVVPPPPPHFTHSLPAGWNLLSTPIKLDADSDSLGQIFGADLANIHVAYGWDAQIQQWVVLTDDCELLPLYGIYVKVKAELSATATFVPSQERSALPARWLAEGVNLIGPAPAFEAGDFPAMPLDVALIRIEKAPGGLRGYTMVISPELNQPGWAYPPDGVQNLLPFRGYWVVMDNPDTLYGFSITPIDP